jgi:hypothetical protein
LSIILIIIFLIGATTSYAEVAYETEITEEHFHLYTIDWIVENNDLGQRL